MGCASGVCRCAAGRRATVAICLFIWLRDPMTSITCMVSNGCIAVCECAFVRPVRPSNHPNIRIGVWRECGRARARCGTALVRSVNKEKSVFSSNAVCSPEAWRFERRVSISPRLWARMRVEALRFRARRVARIIAAGPCIDKDHSSTWSSSSFAGAVEAASSRWST